MWKVRQKVIKKSCLESTSRSLYQISKSSANCWVSSFSLDSCQVVLEKLKGGRQQTNTEVIEYVYFTIRVDKDNRNRTGLVERCLRKRPRSDPQILHRPAAVLPPTRVGVVRPVPQTHTTRSTPTS
jgi:hypothetical protein